MSWGQEFRAVYLGGEIRVRPSVSAANIRKLHLRELPGVILDGCSLISAPPPGGGESPGCLFRV